MAEDEDEDEECFVGVCRGGIIVAIAVVVDVDDVVVVVVLVVLVATSGCCESPAFSLSASLLTLLSSLYTTL
jgi:hypothetical protein